MAIQKPDQALAFTLREEIASRVILLTRDVVDSHDGTTSVFYGAVIHPEVTVYTVDNNGRNASVYETRQLPEFQVSRSSLMRLFSAQVTLDDGTVSCVGEVLASFADQLTAQVLNPPASDTITTQHIDMGLVPATPLAAAEPEPEPPLAVEDVHGSDFEEPPSPEA